MRFLLILWLCKLARFCIKLIAPSRGTDFPGMLAHKLDADFMQGFKLDLNKVIFITGTNGKSSTTNLLYHTLKSAGKKVIANLSGSNMKNGAASVLISGSDMKGRIDADYILIEVDERSFPHIIRQLPGKNLVINNIMQDQVHRNGDPDFIYQLIRRNMPKDMTLFLNNDEPRSKSYEDLAETVRYFGVDRNSASYNKTGIYDVSMPCPYCFSRIAFSYMNSANVGKFSCTQCDFRSNETSLTKMENIDFGEKTFTVSGVKFGMPYDAPIMMYTYAAVIAVCEYIGIAHEDMSRAFDTFENIGGRMDVLHYRGKDIKFYRLKQGNPETIQMAVDAIAQDRQDKVVSLGMCIIPERRPKFVPHYTNTYYAYECNFKPILRKDLKKMMVFSEYIAFDQKNRLLYDGFRDEDIDIVESEDPKTVLDALVSYDCENLYMVAPLRNIKVFKAFLRKEERNG